MKLNSSLMLLSVFLWLGHVLQHSAWRSPCFHYLLSPQGSTASRSYQPDPTESLKRYIWPKPCAHFKTSTKVLLSSSASGNTVKSLWWIKELNKHKLAVISKMFWSHRANMIISFHVLNELISYIVLFYSTHGSILNEIYAELGFYGHILQNFQKKLC